MLAAVLLVALYCGISLGMVAAGRGIPAVFDGNETFSSILHAHNLLTFGPENSAGLADESTSPWLQGHPVVHTHQGNFPRLYATILYALGLRGPTAQVLATVLPVGIVSVLFLFAALRRFVGLGVAAASVGFLLTDYVLFVQWQMVTYRIWHFAFTASLLAAAIFYRSGGRRAFLLAAFVTSFFLFYYELVFATFLSVSISIFTLLLWRRGIFNGILFVGAQLAGAVTGVSILIAQLIVYLGWDGFLADLKLTYISRNVAAPEHLAALREFVEQHHIAFFYNFADPSAHQLGRLMLESIFRWGLQAYTPPFAYCILMMITGVAIALFARPGRVRWPRVAIAATGVLAALSWLFGANAIIFLTVVVAAAVVIFALPDKRLWAQTIGSIDAGMFIGAPAFLFMIVAASFSHFLGFARDVGSWWQFAATISIGFALLFLVGLFGAAPQRHGRVTLDAALRGAAFICGAIALGRFHAQLYDALLTPLWQIELPGPFMPSALEAAGMVLATACGAVLAALGPTLQDTVVLPLRRKAKHVAALIGCFVIGLLVVAILSPGYVHSGYLVRYLNPLVLCFALGVGFVVFVAAVLGRHLLAELKNNARFQWVVAMRLHLLPMTLLAAWWIAIQAADARTFPPRELAVINALQALLPGRPTIVSNTYSGPFSTVTGQWAFLDETFSSGQTAFSPETGYRYLFDKKYLWVADRDNPQYERPDVFLCFIPPTYWSEAIRLVGARRGTLCSENRVVQYAEHPKAVWPRPTVIARDPGPRDTWAIVKLDWDFPPFLGKRPGVTAAISGGTMMLTVTYDYRQQDEKPEQSTDIEIWPVARNGSTCELRGTLLAATRSIGGKAIVTMPQSASELVALVRPRWRARSGTPFFSAPFRVDQGAVAAVDPSCNAIVDTNKRVWPQTGGN